MKLAETLLRHAGYEVFSSGDGLAGLELIKEAIPDIIITDLITPTIDGYDLARAVRADPSTASIPIIMVTAHYLEPEVRRLAAQMHIQHVIIKPFEPPEFLDAVATAMMDSELEGGPKSFPGEFHIGHLRLVSAKLYEKVKELEVAKADFEATASRYRLLFR